MLRSTEGKSEHALLLSREFLARPCAGLAACSAWIRASRWLLGAAASRRIEVAAVARRSKRSSVGSRWMISSFLPPHEAPTARVKARPAFVSP